LELAEATNLSKVFKHSPLFVPEKILQGKNPDDTGWKSISISNNQDKSPPQTTEDQQNLQRFPNEQDFSGTDGDEQPETDHKTDFTTPNGIYPEEVETEISADTSNNQNIDIHPEPPDLEAIQEEAYNRGIQDGLARAEEDFGSSTKTLLMACREINTIRETILHNSMEEMQNLVLIIAEKIIRHSVTEQDKTIIDTVCEAIQQAVKSDEFVIEVNPADLTIINSKSKVFIDSLNGLENIIVRANPAIEQGGCKIDSSTSTVDATVASQLKIIEDALKGTA